MELISASVLNDNFIVSVKHHMARWIATGEIDVYTALPAETIEKALAFIEEKKSSAAPSQNNSRVF
jgi:hypothetical protein